MKVSVFDINYDVDGDEEILATLPKELIVDLDEDENPSEDLADHITMLTGWCVNGCRFEIIQ